MLQMCCTCQTLCNVSIKYVSGRTSKDQDLPNNHECQWGLLQRVIDEEFGSDSVHTHSNAWLLCIALTPPSKSSFSCETAKCIRCLPDLLFCSFSCCPSPSSVPLPPLSLSFPLRLDSLPSFRPVEDVSNLTASDVMNRVNLGYLQGNFCAVYNSYLQHVWWFPSCGERISFFHQHPLQTSARNLSTELETVEDVCPLLTFPCLVIDHKHLIINETNQDINSECCCLELQDISENPYTEGTRPAG